MAEEQEPRRVRKAGHVCVVCQETIPVPDMLIYTVSSRPSVSNPDLLQLVREDKMHWRCSATYQAQFKREGP